MAYQFLAYEASFRGGVTVAVRPIDPMIGSDILTGPGAGGGPLVLRYRAADRTLLSAAYAFDPTFLGGIFVG
jgi:hypothetical protein